MSTTAIPIPPQLITGFRKTIREFVVHNGNTKPKTTMFTGTMMTVPSVTDVGHRSAVDADGDPIPGTYVMRDIYTFVPELGEEIMSFDAEKAVCHVLGIDRTKDGDATTASGSYALAGMSLLPPRPTKEEWQAIARAGEHRAYLASVEHARLIIQAWEEQNINRRKGGLEGVTAGQAERHAQELIARYNAEMGAAVSDASLPKDFTEARDLEELEITAIAEGLAMKMSQKVADEQGVDAVDLFKRLMDNPSVRAYAQKEYRIRKRGHQQIDISKLQKAAAEGKNISDAGLED